MRKFFAAHAYTYLLLILGAHAMHVLAADTQFVDASLIDPTRPSGFSETVNSGEAASETLALTLVRLGPEPLAVINGKNVQPGESINGYRLISLQPTRAILIGSGGRRVLQLSPAIRKPSNFSTQTR